MITIEYEVQVQPLNSEAWHLSGRFPTHAEAETQAMESASQPRPFRAFRVVRVKTVRTAMPGEYPVTIDVGNMP